MLEKECGREKEGILKMRLRLNRSHHLKVKICLQMQTRRKCSTQQQWEGVKLEPVCAHTLASGLTAVFWLLSSGQMHINWNRFTWELWGDWEERRACFSSKKLLNIVVYSVSQSEGWNGYDNFLQIQEGIKTGEREQLFDSLTDTRVKGLIWGGYHWSREATGDFASQILIRF